MLYLLYPTTSNTKDCTVPFVEEWKYHAYHLSSFDRAAMGVGLYLTKSVFAWYSTHSGQKLTNGPLVLIIMDLLAQEPCFLSAEYSQVKDTYPKNTKGTMCIKSITWHITDHQFFTSICRRLFYLSKNKKCKELQVKKNSRKYLATIQKKVYIENIPSWSLNRKLYKEDI